MAPVMRGALLAIAIAGCGDLEGLSGAPTALATVHFEVTGDFESVRVPDAQNATLQVALVWGAQWLPEPLCFVPPETPEVAAVIAAGCRDPFGFVPDRVGETVDVAAGELSLYALPSADVMVGDVTGRIAYASLLVYDDRNGTGRLELGRGRRVPSPDDDQPPADDPLTRDIVYGASFLSMTKPDTRLALREGAYNPKAAFYPRFGCGEPARGFSVLGAGGFNPFEAIAATARGELPMQDPATCREETTDAMIPIPLRPAAEVAETGCTARRADSSVRYREPPVEPIDLTNRVAACAPVPDFGSGEGAGITQYVVSSRSDERCKLLTHYVLRGCREDAACALPDWDITATPPPWWPCL